MDYSDSDQAISSAARRMARKALSASEYSYGCLQHRPRAPVLSVVRMRCQLACSPARLAVADGDKLVN